MSRIGYLESEQKRIFDELDRRAQAERLSKYCRGLISDFGYFNPTFSDNPFELPPVTWRDSGNRLGFILRGQNGKQMTQKSLAGHSPEARAVAVLGIDVTLSTPSTGDEITVASIDPYRGPNASTIVRDFEGHELTIDELLMLQDDLEAYRELVEAGQTEEIPIQGT